MVLAGLPANFGGDLMFAAGGGAGGSARTGGGLGGWRPAEGRTVAATLAHSSASSGRSGRFTDCQRRWR